MRKGITLTLILLIFSLVGCTNDPTLKDENDLLEYNSAMELFLDNLEENKNYMLQNSIFIVVYLEHFELVSHSYSTEINYSEESLQFDIVNMIDAGFSRHRTFRIRNLEDQTVKFSYGVHSRNATIDYVSSKNIKAELEHGLEIFDINPFYFGDVLFASQTDTYTFELEVELYSFLFSQDYYNRGLDEFGFNDLEDRFIPLTITFNETYTSYELTVHPQVISYTPTGMDQEVSFQFQLNGTLEQSLELISTQDDVEEFGLTYFYSYQNVDILPFSITLDSIEDPFISWCEDDSPEPKISFSVSETGYYALNSEVYTSYERVVIPTVYNMADQVIITNWVDYSYLPEGDYYIKYLQPEGFRGYYTIVIGNIIKQP